MPTPLKLVPAVLFLIAILNVTINHIVTNSNIFTGIYNCISPQQSKLSLLLLACWSESSFYFYFMVK